MRKPNSKDIFNQRAKMIIDTLDKHSVDHQDFSKNNIINIHYEGFYHWCAIKIHILDSQETFDLELRKLLNNLQA